MNIAAAVLSVLDGMRSDPAWEPPLGHLFVRITAAPWRHEVTFCYADRPRHHLCLARIYDWQGGADFGGETELSRGEFDTHTGICAVVRRLAEESDVTALVKLWTADKAPGSFRYTIAEWLERVQESGLCDEDKAMIARVVTAGKATP